MKKLIALVALLVSFTSFAATVTWGTGSVVTDPSGATLTTGYMYLVSTSTGAGIPSFSDGSWDMKGGSILTSAGYNSAMGAWIVFDQVLSIPSSGKDYYIVFATDTTAVNDFADLATDSSVLISSTGGTLDITTTDPEGGNNFAGQIEFTVTGDWTTIGTTDVPEPTVLALLALGVAGLALKRKHF